MTLEEEKILIVKFCNIKSHTEFLVEILIAVYIFECLDYYFKYVLLNFRFTNNSTYVFSTKC